MSRPFGDGLVGKYAVPKPSASGHLCTDRYFRIEAHDQYTLRGEGRRTQTVWDTAAICDTAEEAETVVTLGRMLKREYGRLKDRALRMLSEHPDPAAALRAAMEATQEAGK